MSGLGLRVRTLGAAGGVAASLALACGSASDYPFNEKPLLIAAAGAGGSDASGGAPPTSGASGTGHAGGAAAGNAASGGATGDAGRGTGGASTGGAATGGAGAGGGTSAGGVGSLDAGGEAGTGGPEGGAAGEGPSVDCSARGEDARGFDGHCYVFEETRVTFAEAVAACASREAHLVTISSDGRTLSGFLAENTFVWELAAATPVWIAATDGKGPHQKGDGTFSTWLTGEGMGFDNWSSGQPNNQSSACQDDDPCSCNDGACYEHCGFLWDTPGKQMDAVPGWNDRLCDHRIAYVCEWDGA